MKRFVVFTLFVVLGLTTRAQRLYFIYLQTESQEPFFVKMDQKLHSSSSSGYLILSNLRDSTYQVGIGFPGNQWPDQQYSIAMKRKDHGFLLKNLGEKGWGLIDLQSASLLMPVEAKKSGSVRTERVEGNAFNELLAIAEDDTSLRHRPIIVRNEEKKAEPVITTAVREEVKKPKTDSVLLVKKEDLDTDPKNETKDSKTAQSSVDSMAMVKVDQKKPRVKTKVDNREAKPETDSSVLVKSEEKNSEKKEAPGNELVKTKIEEPAKEKEKEQEQEKTKQEPAQEEVYKKSTIVKRSESSTTEGFGLVFLDTEPGGKTDTIRLIIANDSRITTVAQEKKQDEPKFIEMLPVDTAVKNERRETPVVNKYPGTINECKASASQSDFFKLRKKMAAATSDEQMITEARKAFRSKCYSTEQVKNLSTLFLMDKGKYQFFDEAYSHSSDPENFGSLLSELKEEYYINRFKAMLRLL